ncbi:Hpt domain-containing protein [Chloroflexus sp.]|uniref:Hpt domain-containing protein n=1 Tax=Chloroflexus sp. TaxID=1904827 RepID=UPI003C757715
MKPDPAEQFEALRRRYATQIADRIQAIVDAWRRLEQSGWDNSIGTETRQLAHRLAGSAAMFGFADLGAVAREIDIGLKEWLENGRSLNTMIRHHLAQQIEHLQRMLREGNVTAVLPPDPAQPSAVLSSLPPEAAPVPESPPASPSPTSPPLTP